MWLEPEWLNLNIWYLGVHFLEIVEIRGRHQNSNADEESLFRPFRQDRRQECSFARLGANIRAVLIEIEHQRGEWLFQGS